MTCLTDRQLQHIAEGNDISVKGMDYKEHLKDCEKCSEKIKHYKILEDELNSGILIEPPKSIIKFVMKKIHAQAPSALSVFISIIFSFLSIFLITMTYYGFSKDGMVKSIQLFGNIVFNTLHSVVIFMSNIFDYSIIFIKTLNKFAKMILGVGADIELIGLSFIVFLTGMFFVIYKLSIKAKVRREI